MYFFQLPAFVKFMTTAVLAISLSGFMLFQSSHASNPVEFVDYQKVLQEERAWAGLSTKTLRVGDVVWSYSEGGQANKPTLLLIHGIGNSRDTWNLVAHQLSKQYHVIIPDLPGSGNTKTAKNFEMTLPHITEQLRRFVETANIQNNLHIAGHSVGGSIALLYASKYNFDTESLFLISAGGLFKHNQTSYLNNPAYLKQLVVAQPGDLNFVMNKIMYNPPFIPSVIKKQQEKLMISHSLDTAKLITHLLDMNKLYSINTFAAMLKNIEAPTFILWGKQDQIVNVEVATDLKTSLKHARQPVILDQVGHLPIIEAPERVTQHYIEFLNTLKLEQPTQPKP
ncbi:MAG: alpha/beta hydrolase [Candidatus Acinetobacter avistercoris]|uniref:alpha/beta fold hydrolase n=1 Tax=Acinetobacter sp. KS-LM10 TaxID=3120518 RepID=UPI001F8FB6E6|nr:alpha/beta hydrolase [Candidatus Acinetobacter avistercoris]